MVATAWLLVASEIGSVQSWPATQNCSAGSVTSIQGWHTSTASSQLPIPTQGFPACELHVPPAQVSAPLQKAPSLHATLFGLCVQVPKPLHASVVQGCESEVQGVPGPAWESAGQALDAPVQFSAGSHEPPETRHTNPVPAN